MSRGVKVLSVYQFSALGALLFSHVDFMIIGAWQGQQIRGLPLRTWFVTHRPQEEGDTTPAGPRGETPGLVRRQREKGGDAVGKSLQRRTGKAEISRFWIGQTE